jgi:hypothetical protein
MGLAGGSSPTARASFVLVHLSRPIESIKADSVPRRFVVAAASLASASLARFCLAMGWLNATAFSIILEFPMIALVHAAMTIVDHNGSGSARKWSWCLTV